MLVDTSFNIPIDIILCKFTDRSLCSSLCKTVFDLKLAVGRSPGPCFVRIPQILLELVFQSLSSIKASWNVLETQRPCASSTGSASLQRYALKIILNSQLFHYLQTMRTRSRSKCRSKFDFRTDPSPYSNFDWAIILPVKLPSTRICKVAHTLHMRFLV